MRVLETIFLDHDPVLVLLAAVFCGVGSWIAISLLRQTQGKQGSLRTRWTFVTAVASGSAIWCTHFIAMMAFHPGATVTLDMKLTIGSLAVAVLGCTIAIWVAVQRHPAFAPWLGGALAGAAISLMHYTGMAAYILGSPVQWDMDYVLISVILALSISSVAFNFALSPHRRHPVLLGALFFTLAIVALHFTGMAAMTVTPMHHAMAAGGQEALTTMGVAIAAVGLLTIATSLATKLIDSRVSHETIERFQQMALTDALTALPNRVSFAEHLQSALDSARKLAGSKVAVACIDLDRFKEINDLRGHKAGDIALQIIGRRLSNLTTDNAFFARLGGDEFAASIRFSDETQLIDIVDRLEKALFEPLEIGDFRTVTGASIGVAIFPQDGIDRERLLSNADLAMYRAKGDIGRAVCYFEARMDELAHERHALAQDLNLAIEDNALDLYYQPQTSLLTGKIVGYEALVRWKHKDRGMVSPADFIPIAEENGSILAIGEWVLRKACMEAASWDEPHKISVNVSPVQFAHVDLPQLLLTILTESKLAPTRLELEITESTIIEDKQRTLHMLRQIRNLGVTVAIDDFGIGYSSLDTLRSFPFDKIKLDRSFMPEVENDLQAKAIVRAVLALGKSLNIPVLAEGVETPQQLELLKAEGCDEAQGFLLGKPMPFERRAPDLILQSNEAIALRGSRRA